MCKERGKIVPDGDEDACDFAWQREDRDELIGHEEATKVVSRRRRIYEGNEILP